MTPLVCGTKRSVKSKCFSRFSACQKSLTDFFDCASPAAHFDGGSKCDYPKKPDISAFFGRRVIVLEAGLAPSSSPAALFVVLSAWFFGSLTREKPRAQPGDFRVFTGFGPEYGRRGKSVPLAVRRLFGLHFPLPAPTPGVHLETVLSRAFILLSSSSSSTR